MFFLFFFLIFSIRTGAIYANMLKSTLVDESPNCLWETVYNGQQCSELNIDFYLYTEIDYPEVKINPLERSTLQETDWDPHKHNIIFMHGYGSSYKSMPTTILRNAYLYNGSYNVFVVDWSLYSKMHCYASAIHNIDAVAKCASHLYKNLRFQGIPSHQITCVGHDLGAHTCGLISKHVNFRINRIIGLDPTGPMVPNSSKLKSGMANYVQAIYTNAGTFADTSAAGKINFCLNGGKVQPACHNRSLGTASSSDVCSHLMSVCYMAESIDSTTARKALPCARHCPFGPRKSQGPDRPVFVGQLTPDKARGSYCAHTSEPPYCSKTIDKKGHPWCCF